MFRPPCSTEGADGPPARPRGESIGTRSIRLAPARSAAQTTEVSDGISTDRLLNKDVIAAGRPTIQSHNALVDVWFGRDKESDLDDLLSDWESGLNVDAIDEVLAQAEDVGA